MRSFKLFFKTVLFLTIFFLNKAIAIESFDDIEQLATVATTESNNKNSTISKRAKNKIIHNAQAKQKKNSLSTKDKQSQTSSVYNLSERTININSPLCQYAAKNDIVALRKAFVSLKYNISDINTICKYGESLLFVAVKNNNYLAAKFLLDNGANVNLQNNAGVSVLHIVSRVDTTNIDRIFDLLIHSKDLNKDLKDLEGYTPLMRAVQFEKLSVIKTLIRNGADLNVKNNYGYSAIELANLSLEGKKTDEERAISKSIIDLLNS